MDRLRIILCLGLSVVAVRASAAQMLPGATSTGVVAVAGDVLRPNTYAHSPQQRLCLRDVLATAGMTSERASVLILRPAGGAMQSTEIVVRGAAEQGSQLNPGDVVVVQAVGNVDAATSRTAAIVVGDQSLVLSLQDESVTVGDTLAELQIAPQLAQNVQLISISPGRSRRSISYAERLQHGDILVVGRTAGAAGRQSGGFSPQVSEWSSGRAATTEHRPEVPATPVDVHSAPLPPGPFTASGIPQDPLGFLQLQEANQHDAESGSAPSTSAESPFRSVRTQPDPAATTTLELTSGSDTVRDPFLPADYQTEDQRTAVPLIRASLQTPPPEVETETVRATSATAAAVAKPEVAPMPPTESDLAVSTATSGYGLWNILFVGGLLTAGGLIIVGWLKSEAEFRQHESTEKLLRSAGAVNAAAAPQFAVPQTAAPSVPQPTQVQKSVPVAGMSALPTFVSTPAAFESVTQSVATPVGEQLETTDPLVSPHEWLGGDWRANSDGKAGTSLQVERSGAHKALDQWRDSLPPNEPKGDEVTEVSDLSDLIENRLPVDLCETRLPLQIRLHGRPSGPRKLRIDAAHTKLAGPHMHTGADRQQAESPVAAGERAPERKTEGGGLDRALNFLHEQGE